MQGCVTTTNEHCQVHTTIATPTLHQSQSTSGSAGSRTDDARAFETGTRTRLTRSVKSSRRRAMIAAEATTADTTIATHEIALRLGTKTAALDGKESAENSTDCEKESDGGCGTVGAEQEVALHQWTNSGTALYHH